MANQFVKNASLLLHRHGRCWKSLAFIIVPATSHSRRINELCSYAVRKNVSHREPSSKTFCMLSGHPNQQCNIVSRSRSIKRFQRTINVSKYREGQLCCLKLSCRWINNNQILIMACRWCQQCIKSKFLSSSSRTLSCGVSRSDGHGRRKSWLCLL